MYNELILENFTNPTNLGRINGSLSGEATNEESGDIVKFFLLKDDEKITEIKFKALGNAVTVAVANLICTMVENKTVDMAINLTKYDVVEKIGKIPEEKIYTIDLCLNALKLALKQ